VEIPLKARSATLIKTLAVSFLVIAAATPLSSFAQSNPADSSPAQAHIFTAPANLKVLPKDLTGRQVHDIMEQWSGQLGVRCSACHVRDSEGIVPGGYSRPGFADDSKPMKQVARLMYTMTEEINRKFITGDDGVPGPVTCGTCHRGKIRPEPFVLHPDGPGSTAQAPSPQEVPFSR
jgi:photosynthetic reaction center cytochrome c subunit